MIELNRGHPLNRGLVADWLAHYETGWRSARLRDLVNGRTKATLTDAGPIGNWVPAIAGGGAAIDLDGSTEYMLLDNAASSHPTKPALPISIVTAFRTGATMPNFGGMTDSFAADASGNFYGVEFFAMDLGTGLLVRFGDGTGTVLADQRRGDASFTFATNTEYMSVGVIRSATDMSLYVNGRSLTVTPSGSGGGIAYTTAGGRIGELLNNHHSLGRLMHQRIYNVALASHQVLQLFTEFRRNYPGIYRRTVSPRRRG